MGRTWRQAIRRIAIIELIIVVASALISLVLGWSANAFALLLLAVGAVLFAFGPFSMMGGWGTTRNWQYQYIRTLEDQSHLSRALQDAEEIERSIGLIGPLMVLGTITMIISVIASAVL